LREALTVGFTVSLSEIPADTVYALRVFEQERQKYDKEKFDRDR